MSGEGDVRVVGQEDEDGHTTGNRMWDREKLSPDLSMERKG